MALIKCADCGKEVSETAPSCPNCGRPIQSPAPAVIVQKKGGFAAGCGGVLFGVMIAFAVIIGGCVLLVGSCATRMALNQNEGAEYARAWVEIEVTKVAKGFGSYSTIEGSVKNNGTRTITYWQATLKYTDSSGAVIDSQMQNSGQAIRPGESQKFDTLHKDDSRISRVTPYMDRVSLAPQ